MGLLAPAFLAGLAAIAIPVLLHLIHRERRETLAFPSLMFLRKIPYRSVRRQKLRHLLLLAMRCLALAIVAAAFARPFVAKRLAVLPAASDAREIVLLVDRSYSMSRTGRWTRAVSAATSIAREARSVDRVSVVAFASTAEQVLEPTNDVARAERAIASLTPGSEATRFAAGVRMAAQLLSASELPRKEIVLISDFHRFGWTPSDEAPLPQGAVVKTIDVSRKETEDIAVAHVAVARSRARDRALATVSARLANLGSTAHSVDATLEVAGRRVQTRRVTVPPRASAQAVFDAVAVSATPVKAVIRVTPDSQPVNDAFFFVSAEESGAAALVIEPTQPRANQSLYVGRALAVADDPPVRVDVKDPVTVSLTELRGRTLVVMNETEIPAALADPLRALVEEGALLLIAPGERGRGAWPPAWRDVLPARVGPVVDRADGGSWASVDFSNALFEPLRAPGTADFSSVTVTRYRALTPADSSQVIARLDDGAPLLVERRLGKGRVMLWASTLDALWTNATFHPLWVPLLHQLARRSIAGREAPAWFTVSYALDLAGQPSAVVESPSGARFRADAERHSVELRERGFYEVRGGRTAIGAGRPVAVNVELAESDLSHFDPAELVAALTSRSQRGVAASSNALLPGTSQDMERRQSMWWYLLVAAALLLAAETLLANRISRAVGPRASGAF